MTTDTRDTLDTFSQLMQQVGGTLHLGELVLDGGSCCIGIDDLIVNVRYLDGADQVLLYTEVAPLPATHREALFATLLQGQCFFQKTAGATLSLDQGLGAILLQNVQPLRVLDCAAFMNWLENFMHTALYWQEECTKIVEHKDEKHNAPPRPGISAAGVILG